MYLQARKQYCVLLKVRYLDDKYAMLDCQIPFKFDSYTDETSFKKLRVVIASRLKTMLDTYGLEDNELNMIQLLYKEMEYGELERLKVDGFKGKIPVKEYHHLQRLSRYIPLSFDTVSYGIPLKVTSNNKVESIKTLVKDSSPLQGKGEYIDFLANLNNVNTILKSKEKYITNNKQFYQNNVEGLDYILVAEKVGDNKILKEAYTVYGIRIEKTEDTDMLNNSYIRNFGKYTLLIKNNKIIFSEKKIVLSPIKSPIHKDKGNIIEDTRIGVIDLETYNIDSSTAKVYALGFYTNLDDKPVLYYIDQENLDSNEIVINCINEMLRPKYKGVTFYAHNLGKFDVVFIIKALLEHNELNNSEDYKLETVCRDDIILKLKIKHGSDSVIILDSYRILTDNLKSLCVKYKVDVIKGDFPHKFANKDTLFYVGQTPNLNYYPSTLELDEYKALYKEV